MRRAAYFRLRPRGADVGVLVLLAARWIDELLFKTTVQDPATFGVVVLTLLAVALAASLAPALRAARVDPLSTVRAE